VALIVGGGAALGVRILSYSDSLTPEKQREWHLGKSALDILDEKYASNEISTDQYNERRQILMKNR
jgi:uncharacterized membrane protein